MTRKPGKRALAYMEKQRQYKAFLELNLRGSGQYGLCWLRATQATISILLRTNLVPEENRFLGATIAWELCTWEERATLRERDRGAGAGGDL